MKYKRVLVKLSGEALAGDKQRGFDHGIITEVAKQLKVLVESGIEVSVVIGGGNFWRGRTSGDMDRTKADQIGMLATVMNAIYVADVCRALGMETSVQTPFVIGSMTELFSKDSAVKHLKEGKIVFFAGGTGHPFFSTDTGAALRAQRLKWMHYYLPKISMAFMIAIQKQIQLQKNIHVFHAKKCYVKI